MGNSLKNPPYKTAFHDVATAVYPNNPRKDGEYEVRSNDDLIGKSLLEERDRIGNEDLGKRVTGYTARKDFLPHIPGYVPEKLNNLYAMQKYLDSLCKLAYDARKVNHDDVAPILLSTVGQVVNSVKEFVTLKDPLTFFKLPVRVITAGLDVASQGREASIKLHQEVTKKSIEYAHYNFTVMMGERRDTFAFRLSEVLRGFVSHNRQEYWTMGAALVGIHQMIEFAIGEMERESLKAFQGVKGSTHREAVNIAARIFSRLK